MNQWCWGITNIVLGTLFWTLLNVESRDIWQWLEHMQLERFGTFTFGIFWLFVFRGQSLLLSRTDLQIERLQMWLNFWVTAQVILHNLKFIFDVSFWDECEGWQIMSHNTKVYNLFMNRIFWVLNKKNWPEFILGLAWYWNKTKRSIWVKNNWLKI